MAGERVKPRQRKSKTPDSPTSPSHYTQGGIESIDYIKAQGWFPGFACGNILKYVTRYPHKNGVEDLYKARLYLDWLIEHEEASDATQEDSNASVG